jgi:hypothetical protein
MLGLEGRDRVPHAGLVSISKESVTEAANIITVNCNKYNSMIRKKLWEVSPKRVKKNS